VANKNCPSCGESVPAAASRCKHCFHDFNEEAPKKSFSLVGFMAFLLVLASLGAGTLAYVYYSQVQEKIVVDVETQSIVFTRTSTSKTTSERLAFADVVKIEHVLGGETATFEVVAITAKGERYIINQSSEGTLRGYAEHIAAVMDKPIEDVKTIKTFGD
jgi:uncharacterized protein (DUF1786 family)